MPRSGRIGRSLPLVAVPDTFATVALAKTSRHTQALRRLPLAGLVHDEDGDGAAGRHLRRD